MFFGVIWIILLCTFFSFIFAKKCLTLTTKIIPFLQEKEAILARVTRMAAGVRLTVTLSTSLNKQIGKQKETLTNIYTFIFLTSSHQYSVIRLGSKVFGLVQMKILTCSHSPMPLSVPFSSHWHSGMRRRRGGTKPKNRGYAVNKLWLQACVTCETQQHKTLQCSEIHNIKGPQAQITAQRGKKNETFPEYPAAVNLRHSSDIKKASRVFRRSGRDNNRARERNCNKRLGKSCR